MEWNGMERLTSVSMFPLCTQTHWSWETTVVRLIHVVRESTGCQKRSRCLVWHRVDDEFYSLKGR